MLATGKLPPDALPGDLAGQVSRLLLLLFVFLGGRGRRKRLVIYYYYYYYFRIAFSVWNFPEELRVVKELWVWSLPEV